jgi:hypothetical protein
MSAWFSNFQKATYNVLGKAQRSFRPVITYSPYALDWVRLG